jgi:hypothetical protein
MTDSLNLAMSALNPYKQQPLREAWGRGFFDSPSDNYQGNAFKQLRGGKSAYGRGWNARRDVHNIERYPVIEIDRQDSTADVADERRFPEITGAPGVW